MLANKIWYQNCKNIPKKTYFTRTFLYSFLLDTAQKLHTNNSKTGALFQLKLRLSKNAHIPQQWAGDPGHYTKTGGGGKSRNCKY